MYERIDSCPLCESGHFRNYMICQDFTVTNESFAIVECVHCGLKFTNPRPNEHEIGKFYNSEEYVSHSNKSQNSLLSFAYNTVRNKAINSKYKIIDGLETEHGILDIGCGTGKFLKFFQDKGWGVTGVEPNKIARSQAINLMAENQIYDSIDLVPTKPKYHIITLWHVLEHIHDINETLIKLKKLLRKKGYMLVAVPNIESEDAKNYKEYWAGYDVPRHLYHFSKKTLTKLLQKHKLRVVKTLPLFYDSYYVSLLSEKYKTGSNNYITALKNGFRSNQEAKKTNEYSSLIYIIKK